MTASTSQDSLRIYVLDTNVLMHDPTALYRFEEHDVYLPMIVLEELDAAKKGMSEVARNVRQVSRFLDELMRRTGNHDLTDGLELRHPEDIELDANKSSGRLWFQTSDLSKSGLSRKEKPDNQILSTALELKNAFAEREVVLVSKDINLRIKATVLGIVAEDYHNDRALDDLSLLYSGVSELPSDFWDHQDRLESWTEAGDTFYRTAANDQWYPNQCLYLDGQGQTEALVQSVGDSPVIRVAQDYRSNGRSVWGIMARNREQNFALNLLLDPNIDFVTLLGTAGTGKTLLTLAAGLQLTLEDKQYNEIIMTRATVPVGDDIGFLPGTEEEKMTPWMGALSDNLEVLTETGEGGDWGRAATSDLVSSRVKVRSLNFMRGRTFLNRYVIIDEAQNLTPKQMKTLLTRAGPGTKMVCLGNVEQIDTPYLTETTSGLTFAVDRFKQWEHAGHITLRRGERSRLADYASENL